jgi:hypothetical protein
MAKKKKSSGKGFNPKQFLLFHSEKIIFGMIVALSCALVYFGVSVERYQSSKTPEKLKKDAEASIQEAKTKDHWPALMEAEPNRVEQTNFTLSVEKGREKAQWTFHEGLVPYKDGPKMKRKDPELLPPIKPRAVYYSGAFAELRHSDQLNVLEDAKVPEQKKPPKGSGGPGGPGGSGSGSGYEGEGSSGPGMGAGGMGSGGMGAGMGSGGMGSGGMGAGMGGGAGGDAEKAKRFLSPGYDKGFAYGMVTNPAFRMPKLTAADKNKKPNLSPNPIQMIVVTALAPHAELEKKYQSALEDAKEYMPGRDTPFYQGYEIERAEVAMDGTAGAWVKIGEHSLEKYNEQIKKLEAKLDKADAKPVGSCREVHPDTWVTPNLIMPIPPVLLTDYRQFASHPDIPPNTPDMAPDEDPSKLGNAGGGLGSGYEGSGGMPGGGMGMGPGAGMGSGGMGSGGMGAGMGYGGEGPGYGGDGGSGPGYGGEGSSGPGYGSEGDGGSGMPGMGSGMGAGMGGMGGMPSGIAPARLPSTKFKLVRFIDTSITQGKAYRYRVRLQMYDPNFPEYEAIAPNNVNLDDEAVRRVQKLREIEKPNEETRKRKSIRISDWSEPTEIVQSFLPTPIYAAGPERSNYQLDSKGDYIKMGNFKTKVSWLQRKILVLDFARVEDVTNGSVLGMGVSIGNGTTNLTARKSTDPALFVHPVTKILKLFQRKQEGDAKKPASAEEKAKEKDNIDRQITVVDVRGHVPLAVHSAKDDLRSGGEVISFDTLSGQLIVSREFDDFTMFNMCFQPDKPAVGVLGGGMAGAGAGGMGSGGMGSGGMGGGMGMPGMGGEGSSGPGYGMGMGP